MTPDDTGKGIPIHVAAGLPSRAELLLQTPLYDAIALDKDNPRHTAWLTAYLLKEPVTVDSYCLECGRESVFEVRHSVTGQLSVTASYRFTMTASCTRNMDHKMILFLRIHDGVLLKEGQWPSLADLAQEGLRRYRRELEEQDYFELNRAVGLAAHGVGIGSYVYLRRVLERLIERVHQHAMNEPAWSSDTEAQYQRARFSEKVEALGEWLPEFLVENRALYSVISVGVHELTEEQCLAAFPPLRGAIELILDREIEAKKRSQKERELRQALSKLGPNQKK